MLRIRGSAVSGAVDAPPSKSYTHRALALALLADRTRIEEPLLSEDPRATLDCVRRMGATVETDGDALVVAGGEPRAGDDVLQCLNSGTTMRLFTALAALPADHSVLTGDASLRRRPMQPLLDALRGLGADAFATHGNGCAPLVVRGPLASGETFLPGDVSSQFVSALVLAGTQVDGGIAITLTSELKSRPYVEITLDMLKAFGGGAEATPSGFAVDGPQDLRGGTYRVPGDWSTAAFPLAAAAVTGGDVAVRNLDARSAQGDKAVLDALRAFGAAVREREDGSVTATASGLDGIELDLSDTPDMFPALCAIAVHARGTTVLKGAKHLRFKESDRIAAMVGELRKMGADVDEREDGAVVRGGRPLRGAKLHTFEDHRILMALAIAALRADGETVLDEHESCAVSYPRFIDDFKSMGAAFEVV